MREVKETGLLMDDGKGTRLRYQSDGFSRRVRDYGANEGDIIIQGAQKNLSVEAVLRTLSSDQNSKMSCFKGSHEQPSDFV